MRTWAKLGAAAGVALVMVAGQLAAAELPPLAAAARIDLAQRLGLDLAQVEVARLEERQWPNAALGLPKPGMSYAQMVCEGHRVVFLAQGRPWLYHTGDLRFARGPAAEEISPAALRQRGAELFGLPVVLTGDLFVRDEQVLLAERALARAGGWLATEPAVEVTGEVLRSWLRRAATEPRRVEVCGLVARRGDDPAVYRVEAVAVREIDDPRAAPADVSLAELLRDPEQWQARVVRVTATLYRSSDGCRLAADEYLLLPVAEVPAPAAEALDGRRVRVTGIFARRAGTADGQGEPRDWLLAVAVENAEPKVETIAPPARTITPPAAPSPAPKPVPRAWFRGAVLFLPLREVAEFAGLTTRWAPATKTVEIIDARDQDPVRVGSLRLGRHLGTVLRWSVVTTEPPGSPDPSSATGYPLPVAFEQLLALPAPAEVRGGVFYAPVEFVESVCQVTATGPSDGVVTITAGAKTLRCRMAEG